MNRKFTCSLLFLLMAFALGAQKANWKKLGKEADEHYARGEYKQAAVKYRAAYRDNNKKTEFAFKAGECFLMVREYENALRCFEPVKQENAKFDKPGYRYALCLKQTGSYEKAKKEFQAFVANYKGGDKAAWERRAELEVEGCDLALEWKNNAAAGKLVVELLPEQINSEKTEFAPIPFETPTGEAIYFSSNVDGAAKIYRIEKGPQGWGALSKPDIFTKLDKKHYGNGSITPDAKRFYFTQCEILPDGSTNCAIYLTEQIGDQFAAPVRLPDYVNTPGANTTHPHVGIIGDKEVLFFSSNREGTRGGMDLWYVTKNQDAQGVPFGNPVNLGAAVNTAGDEATPYYDPKAQTLFFSSNGLPGMGGLDIFASKGEFVQNSWSEPENLGMPYNSPADDLYYTPRTYRTGAFVVSNRTFEPGKPETSHDDIFYIGPKEIFFTLKGSAVDKANPKADLSDAKITLFEVLPDGLKMLKEENSPKGTFSFRVLAGKEYLIKASRVRYRDGDARVNALNIAQPQELAQLVGLEKIPARELVLPLYASSDTPFQVDTLQPPVDPVTKMPFGPQSEEVAVWREIVAVAKKSQTLSVYYDENGQVLPHDPIIEKPVVLEDPAAKKKGKARKPRKKGGDRDPENDRRETAARAKKYASPPPGPGDDKTLPGRTFKIQLAAVSEVRTKHFLKAADVGDIEEERTEDEKLIRVMVAPFTTINQARAALTKLLDAGYEDAFIIQYENNRRTGEGFR
jgi:hypothetical protein